MSKVNISVGIDLHKSIRDLSIRSDKKINNVTEDCLKLGLACFGGIGYADLGDLQKFLPQLNMIDSKEETESLEMFLKEIKPRHHDIYRGPNSPLFSFILDYPTRKILIKGVVERRSFHSYVYALRDLISNDVIHSGNTECLNSSLNKIIQNLNETKVILSNLSLIEKSCDNIDDLLDGV